MGMSVFLRAFSFRTIWFWYSKEDAFDWNVRIEHGTDAQVQ